MSWWRGSQRISGSSEDKKKDSKNIWPLGIIKQYMAILVHLLKIQASETKFVVIGTLILGTLKEWDMKEMLSERKRNSINTVTGNGI